MKKKKIEFLRFRFTSHNSGRTEPNRIESFEFLFGFRYSHPLSSSRSETIQANKFLFENDFLHPFHCRCRCHCHCHFICISISIRSFDSFFLILKNNVCFFWAHIENLPCLFNDCTDFNIYVFYHTHRRFFMLMGALKHHTNTAIYGRSIRLSSKNFLAFSHIFRLRPFFMRSLLSFSLRMPSIIKFHIKYMANCEFVGFSLMWSTS